jgi:hypothetical protein
MGNYIAHRPRKQREVRQAPRAPQVDPAKAEAEHRARVAARLARRWRIAEERRASLNERAAQLEHRQERRRRAGYRTELERRAQRLFPWGLLRVEREIAAGLLVSDIKEGVLHPVLDMARLFAIGALQLDPRDHGVENHDFAKFIQLSAPQTRSVRALWEAAGFCVDVRLVEAGKAFSAGFDETLPDEVVEATEKRIGAVVDSVERRLAALPDWLRVLPLNYDWFIIRLTPRCATEIWAEVSRAHEAPTPRATPGTTEPK